MFSTINVSRLQEGLRTKRFGKSIFFAREVGSTNEWAKQLAKLGAEEGTVTIAETQTAGRGRLNREWFSPHGGLWFSVVMRPQHSVAEAVKLVFVAGLAVAETLHGMYGLRVETKWPNDVLVGGKKVCGILTEMNAIGKTVNFAIAGIGVNANFSVKVFPEPLHETATSLVNELGRKVRLEELFKVLLEHLEMKYDLFTRGDSNRVLTEWKEYAHFIGHKVGVTSWNETFNGLALDIDHDGALILKLQDGEIKRVLVGDVTLKAY